jgi:hypothetical protein
MLVGFLGMAAVFAITFAVWGNHIEHRIDRIVVERHGDHRAITKLTHEIHRGEVIAGSGSNPSGQPAPGGPAHGTSKGTETAPKSENPPSEANSQPTGTDTSATTTSAPGLLDPALHTVCSLADRLAHLCN